MERSLLLIKSHDVIIQISGQKIFLTIQVSMISYCNNYQYHFQYGYMYTCVMKRLHKLYMHICIVHVSQYVNYHTQCVYTGIGMWHRQVNSHLRSFCSNPGAKCDHS